MFIAEYQFIYTNKHMCMFPYLEISVHKLESGLFQRWINNFNLFEC